MFRFFFWAAMTLSGVLPAHAQPAARDSRLHALFSEEWERGLRESPENAS